MTYVPVSAKSLNNNKTPLHSFLMHPMGGHLYILQQNKYQQINSMKQM